MRVDRIVHPFGKWLLEACGYLVTCHLDVGTVGTMDTIDTMDTIGTMDIDEMIGWSLELVQPRSQSTAYVHEHMSKTDGKSKKSRKRIVYVE